MLHDCTPPLQVTQFGVGIDAGTFLRAIASLTATVLGAILLIADGGVDCEHYGAFKGSADYSSGCAELAGGQGTLSLDWPAGADPENTIKRQLQESGFRNVSQAIIQYDGSCSGGEGEGTITGVRLIFARDEWRSYCDTLQLPVTEVQTLSCAIPNVTDAQLGGVAAECLITFRPSAN